MAYPLQITPMDCSPLVIDNGYKVVDQTTLVQWVAQLLLGNSQHITRVIEGLDSNAVNMRNNAMDSIINRLNTCGVYKRDGWLFQMIFWIALNINLHNQYGSGNVFMNAPHTAPAQRGINFSEVALGLDMTAYFNACVANTDNVIYVTLADVDAFKRAHPDVSEKELCYGHDILERIYVRAKAVKVANFAKKPFFRRLRRAYPAEKFVSTQLFKDIKKWETVNGYAVLAV